MTTYRTQVSWSSEGPVVELPDVTPPPEPVRNIPIGIRRWIRERFEAKKPELEAQLSKVLSYSDTLPVIPIEVDIPQLYAYAQQQWQKESFGGLLTTYVEKLIEGIERYTDSGKDTEALDQLTSLLDNPKVKIRADSNVSYCSVYLADGGFEIVFKPDYFGYNLDNVANLYNLTQMIDRILESLDPNHIPLSTRRCEKSKLLPRLQVAKDRLRTLLALDSISITYNIREMLNHLRVHSNLNEIERRTYRDAGELDSHMPEDIAKYVEAAIDTLERHGFGKDTMLREAWLYSAPKGIMVEVAMKMKSDAVYNECLFEDGYFKLRTLPRYYGVRESQIAEKVLDGL